MRAVINYFIGFTECLLFVQGSDRATATATATATAIVVITIAVIARRPA